jgi:hypothetical protein
MHLSQRFLSMLALTGGLAGLSVALLACGSTAQNGFDASKAPMGPC